MSDFVVILSYEMSTFLKIKKGLFVFDFITADVRSYGY